MSMIAIPEFVARRGRPSAEQVAAIEHTIVATARRMFLESGFDAVAMEGVAAAAGVSKGTLYARHSSKESLFEAVVKASVDEWSAIASRNDHLLSDDLPERLRHYVRSIAHSLVDPDVRVFQRLVLSNSHRFPRLARALYENGYLFLVDMLTSDIEAAAKRDDMPVRDAGGVARHFVGAITGWQMQEGAGREPLVQEIEAFGYRVVEFLIAARSLW